MWIIYILFRDYIYCKRDKIDNCGSLKMIYINLHTDSEKLQFLRSYIAISEKKIKYNK